MTLSDTQSVVSRNLEDNVREMLKILGEDPSREGLLEAIGAVVRAWGRRLVLASSALPIARRR